MVENFIAEAFSLLAIGLIVIGLRLYSRCLSVGVRRLAADDYLMVVAGVCCIAVAPHFDCANHRGSACTQQRL